MAYERVHRLSSRSSRRRGESLASSSVEVRADLATAGQATDAAAVLLPKIDSISPLVPSDTSPTPRKATSPWALSTEVRWDQERARAHGIKSMHFLTAKTRRARREMAMNKTRAKGKWQ
jgi:hypothetical protein